MARDDDRRLVGLLRQAADAVEQADAQQADAVQHEQTPEAAPAVPLRAATREQAEQLGQLMEGQAVLDAVDRARGRRTGREGSDAP